MSLVAAPEKSRGQLAYEEDVRRRPLYDDQTKRPHWSRLRAIARYSWQRKPVPRTWK